MCFKWFQEKCYFCRRCLKTARTTHFYVADHNLATAAAALRTIATTKQLPNSKARQWSRFLCNSTPEGICAGKIWSAGTHSTNQKPGFPHIFKKHFLCFFNTKWKNINTITHLVFSKALFMEHNAKKHLENCHRKCCHRLLCKNH